MFVNKRLVLYCKWMDKSEVLILNDTIQIPLSELSFQFSPSRGPGGQHVNRAHTRATLIFDLSASPSLDDETRARLLQNLDNRLDKQGTLRLSVQESRSQHRNRELAIARLLAILVEALEEQPERIATRPSRHVHARRIEEKRRQGRRKRERSRDWLDE